MGFAWRKIRRSPQTYLLLVGAGLGYLCFILWLSPRLIVLGIGGGITMGMLTAWLWQFKQRSTLGAPEANLLEFNIFLKQLEPISRKVGKHSGSTWKKTLQWARETQEFAVIIANREPTLTPELLETLYTVLGLTKQVADGLEAVGQIRTATYRDVAQQRLQDSCTRLQTTHAQLQNLQDQIVLASLTSEASPASSALPQRLQSLIADNKTVLQPSSKPS